MSSSGDSRNDDEEKERRSPRERESKDRDKDTECKHCILLGITHVGFSSNDDSTTLNGFVDSKMTNR